MYHSTHFLLQQKMEVSGQCHILATLSLERNPGPIQQKAGWASQPVQTFWRSEKSLASNVIQTPEYPAHYLVTIPPMLSWSSTNLCIFMNTETYITYYLIQGCEGDSMMCHIICKLYAETIISLWDLFFFKLNLHPAISHNFSISNADYRFTNPHQHIPLKSLTLVTCIIEIVHTP